MSDNQVEEIKNKVQIEEIIGERVNLKRAGRSFKGLCPFHGEKTPSFFVTPDIQVYKCFGCGEAGDVYSFLQKYEGMSFPEALEYLAKRAGVTLVRMGRTETDGRRERLLELLHLSAEYYHYLLMEHAVGERARIYLKSRGLQKRMLLKYQLGYAPENWQGLEQYLVGKKKFTGEEMMAAGMSVRTDRGRTYDRFRGRVMFPQQTMQGTTVGFSGRVLDPEVKEAKYVNTPETNLYHKGEIVFGLSQARKAIREKDRVILVEGELDVISSYQVGVKEVVAIKGSALTEGQLALIRRLTKTVYLALDADTAGQEAIRRAILLCEPSGMNLRVVQLTGGKDPDAIAQADRDKWKQLVGAAVSVYQFYIDLACRTYDPKTGLGLKQITEMVLPQLNLIENSVEQAYYVKQLAERLGIGAGVVERELIKGRAGISVKQFGTQTGEKEAEERMGRQERLERFTLRLLLHQEGSVREKLAQVEGEWFVEGYLRRALLKLKETAGEGDTVRVVLSRLGTAERQLLEAIYTEKQDWQEGEIEAAARQLSEAAARLELNYWHARQRAIVGEMATAEPEKLVALRAEQRKIQDVLKELEGE